MTHVRAVSRHHVLLVGFRDTEWDQGNRIWMPKVMSLYVERIMTTFGGERL